MVLLTALFRRDRLDGRVTVALMARRDGIGAVRVAVTGSPVSPQLFEVMASLGRERALARIRNAQQR